MDNINILNKNCSLESNSLMALYPGISDEWDYEYNYPITPDMIYPGSNKQFGWICFCGAKYVKSPLKRIYRNARCSKCGKGQHFSITELTVFYYIKKYFDDAICHYKINHREIDIYIPSLTVGIEYDGYMYHKNRLSQDINNTIIYTQNGIEIFRIRESGLEDIRHKNCTCWIIRKNNREALQKAIMEILSVLKKNNNLTFDIDINITRDYDKIYAVYKSMVKDLPNRLFETRLTALSNFIMETGKNPHGYDRYDNISVASFYRNICYQKHNGLLTLDNEAKINQVLGVDWYPLSHSHSVNEYVEKIEEYMKEFGKFPSTSTIYKGLSIGNWISNNRADYKHGRMNKDVYDIIDNSSIADMILRTNKQRDVDWDKHYEEYKQYVEMYHKQPSGEHTIVRWVKQQREKYQKQKLPLSQVQKLNDLGMIWDFYSFEWNRKYQLVMDFINIYNRLPYQREKYDGEAIGKWISTQIQNYRKDGLSSEKYILLREIGIL